MTYPFIAAIYNQLVTPATTLYGLVGSRVYNGLAPQNSALPCVIIRSMSGTWANDSPAEYVELLYSVVGLALTQAPAEAVDAAIAERLHGATLSLSGWVFLSLDRESVVSLDTDESGAPEFQRGAIYRLKAVKGT